MRMFVFGAVALLTVSTTALWAARAKDSGAPPRSQCRASFSIDPRALTDKATEMPTQQIDDLI